MTQEQKEPAVPEVTRLGQITKEEFIANPPEGFVYDATLRTGLLAHRGTDKTTVGDAFFKLPPEERLSLLHHEEGHDLMRNFNRDWKDVLEPIRKDPETKLGANSRWDNPFGLSELPEELVADAYASLWQGSTKWFEDPNFPANKILRQVIGIAKREGKPLPPQNEIQFVSGAPPAVGQAKSNPSSASDSLKILLAIGLPLLALYHFFKKAMNKHS